MTELGKRIAALIAAAGPIPVSDYMATCLFDPEHGYYTTRDPFGAGGDFVTAPEVSQMFGELVAVWIYSAWRALGEPWPVTLTEIGPGRGTLMKDMIRTLGDLDRSFLRRLSVAMVEASPRLAEEQKRALAGAPVPISWHSTIGDLAEQPLLIVGNELFDAIPVRQFVRAGELWRERMVGLEGDGLRFVLGAAALDPALLPPGAEEAPEGSVVEHAPQRTALMDELAGRLAARGGAGLFIDYGHVVPGIGDTLQAVRRHGYEDALASPGEADLTAHVDFAALAAAARRRRLDAHLTTQGEFLLRMGLLERAGALGRNADEITRGRLRGEVERLAAPEAMGDLFKVLAVTPDGLRVPPFPA